MTVAFVILVFALVFFTLSAFNVPSGERFNFVGAGLALVTLAFMLGAWK